MAHTLHSFSKVNLFSASKINAATNTNKTLILRSANNDIKTNLRSAKNAEDIFEQEALPTSEPPDFMNNYNGLRLTTKGSTTFSTAVIDFYTTMAEADTNTNFFLTLHEVPETTRRKNPEPPRMQDQLPLDPGLFWANLASHGHWDHLDSYLNLSYWLNPKRTSTYATRKFQTSSPLLVKPLHIRLLIKRFRARFPSQAKVILGFSYKKFLITTLSIEVSRCSTPVPWRVR